MKKNDRLWNWGLLVAIWVLFANLLASLTVLQVKVFIQMAELEAHLADNPIAAFLHSEYQYMEATFFGFFFGTIFFLVDEVFDKTPIRKKSFGLIILIKTLLYLLSMLLISFIIFQVYKWLDLVPLDDFIQYLRPGLIFSLLLFFAFAILITNYIMLINRKFGPGNMLAMFFGKYHRPRVEERVFMFIDLKSSTTYAELLGHLKYSQMIQDCFHELNAAVRKHQAEIYQYVGDEAVLTWKSKNGLKQLNCLKTFFTFQQRIKNREKRFEKKYGFVPEFKAGVNMGSVTVAEVGDIKREIAYHGDVLNTGSRIQHLCNMFRENLLATDTLIAQLPDHGNFSIEKIGKIRLKGKTREVTIYSIAQPEMVMA
ncbi:MAG: adenylate/guanylate cyclase domain-containing protein [Candidatus Cyclobacteriaceae bacterium M3_2C_046]